MDVSIDNINSLIHPSIHPSIHPFIHPFVHSLLICLAVEAKKERREQKKERKKEREKDQVVVIGSTHSTYSVHLLVPLIVLITHSRVLDHFDKHGLFWQRGYDEHKLQDLPPGSYHHPQDEEEGALPLLDSGGHGGGPFNSPYDSHSQGGLRANSPPVRPVSAYSLTETYANDPQPYSSDYNSSHTYNEQLEDNPYPRGDSPLSRAETTSTEAWRQRQAPQTGGLKRYATRKVKLVQAVF
ncbi:hypothetical protein EYC84_005896 [Monilinia fructicola]|uniref:Uncharacterized protein n=1 Tax=Monilinia fructicola TaxID=38448 RepID=A0A5M9JY20_MONFR|nr:hypothetical protein EYC84_005896 [Monilinia fructicola]